MFLYRPEHHTYWNTLVVYCWNQLFPKPVLHIRLTASGCLSPVALTIFAFSFGGIYYSWLLPRTRILFFKLLVCRSWYAVCTWYAESRCVGCRLWYAVCIWYAGFGMLSASGMQDFLLHFCECTSLSAEIFFFCEGNPLLCIFFFFCKFERAFFALFKIFFWILCFSYVGHGARS